MSTVAFLIIFPLVAALILLLVKSYSARGPIVMISSALIAIFSVFLVAENYGNGITYFWPMAEKTVDLIGLGFRDNSLFSVGVGSEIASEIMGNMLIALEVIISLVIIYLGVKYKKYLASILAAIQAPILVWFEYSIGHRIPVANNMYVDNFSMIMVLIIGIIGTLICIYAVPYMKDFRKHHPEGKDRSPYFFFLLFLFLSAMFGIVLSNNMMWMFFFWEITTLCSFLLIGYTKTPEAIRNSFRALIINLSGGIAFLLGIVVMGNYYHILELDKFIEAGIGANQMGGSPVVSLVVSLLAFAGITKAAQMPFNSWLLGAMVAPTPTSALLHSSTMVKAGVFLIVKLSPLLGVSSIVDIGPGFMVVMIGGVTFLLASLAAVTQSNAKRVLAYSTVANLGLIVACAGIGTPEGVWAATLLIIFHAVTKSLLFLCVGTAEHNIDSRDIESMDGLFGKLPRLATFMIIGIAAMFMAPFGMLVSKWAALQSFVDSSNVWVILCICFGSAVMLFYWGKWLGKLVAIIPRQENIQSAVHTAEWFTLRAHIVLIVIVSLTFPFISDTMVMPYMEQVFNGLSDDIRAALSSNNMIILIILVALIFVLPLLFYGKSRKRVVGIYMAGVNKGDDLSFTGAMDKEHSILLRNWYMEDMINEKRMNKYGIIITCTIFTITFSYMLSYGIMLINYLITGGAA